MTNRRLWIRFVMAIAIAGVMAGARTGMHALAGAGFPVLPTLKHGEGDMVSIAVAVNNQVAGLTYSATGLPLGVHIETENFTDAQGVARTRGVLRGTLRTGAAGTDPVTNAGSYTGDEGIYSVQIQASDSSVSNTFTWDVGRWGEGDVFVGGGTYTYQVYSKDSEFKFDVRVDDPNTTQGFTTGCAANWHTGEVWATNFENTVNVITRHAGNAQAPYTDASRALSTIRLKGGGAINPIDLDAESIAFDNAQNMYVGHSFGWANNNGEPADINGAPVWLDDNFSLPTRFNNATSYYIDWNRYKTTSNPGPGLLFDDFGTTVSLTFPYPVVPTALWNEAVAAWGTSASVDWNVRKGEGLGLLTVDAAGAPIRTSDGSYIPFDQPISPDGFYETMTGTFANYVLSSLGAKIPLREQLGMDVHKYPLAPAGYGRDLVNFPTRYSNVRYGLTGADTLDLMSDQRTMIYSSEVGYLYRFDMSTNAQMPVVGSSVLSGGTSTTDPSYPIVHEPIYGVRVLPPGDGSGGYLVVVDSKIHRLDTNGRIVQSYDVLNDPFYPGGDAEGYFAMAIAPDGRSFWGATRQDVYHFDIATGRLLQGKIHATDGVVHTNAVVDGVCVMNEYRAARENCGVDGRGNGLDDDGDGVIDNGCFRLEVCSVTSPGDDDGNGLVDYNDPACYAPGTQPASTVCAPSGAPTDASVGGFCARQNGEGDAVSIAAVPPPCSGADCANWTISYSATGLPPGLTINAQTGAITGSPLYTIVPNLATAPPQVFNVTVTGSWQQTGQLPAQISSTFPWTITNTNRPPVAVDDSTRAQSGQLTTISVLTNDSDPDTGDVLSIAPGSVTTPMTAGLVPTGTAVIAPNGTSIQFTAPANFFGTVTFFYQTRDNYATPGVSNQAKVTVVVNGSPVARDDSYQMQGAPTLTVNAANGIIQNLAGRDTDPEGSTLTVFSNTAPAHGAVVVNADGSFTYTPVTGFIGTDTFTYIVTDGEARSNSATVSILVPNPPTAVNDTYATQQNTALVVSQTFNGLLANDSDPLGAPIRVSAFTNPAHGTLVMNPLNDGTFTYTPTTGFTGQDTFTYRVTNGNYESTNATVTITVLTTNNAPVAVNDRYLATAGQTLTVAAGAIMLNDSDPDRDLITASLVTGPSQAGTFSFTAGSGAFSYAPAPGVLGDVTFTYKVTDPYGLSSNVATVTIHVNTLPVARNDAYTTAEDTTLTVPAAGILSNDTDPDAGAVMTVVLPMVTGPTHGTLTQQANGAFVYVPQANYNGTDSYTYRVVDENGGLSQTTATVTITVTPVNDPPVAVADSFSVLQGNVLAVTNPAQGVIQRNDSDIDDAVTVLRASLVNTVAHGTLQFNADGTFTYTPASGFSGQDTFTYFVSDAANAPSNTVTVTITVIPTSVTAATTAVCSSNAAYVDYALTAVNFTFPTGTTTQIDWVDSSGPYREDRHGAAAVRSRVVAWHGIGAWAARGLAGLAPERRAVDRGRRRI